MRRVIRAETTKVEAYNDFLDWVSFGGPVIKSGDPVEQEKQLKYASLVANMIMLSNVAELSQVLSDIARILRFGRYALDMGDLPDPLDPQPLPFERTCDYLLNVVRTYPLTGLLQGVAEALPEVLRRRAFDRQAYRTRLASGRNLNYVRSACDMQLVCEWPKTIRVRYAPCIASDTNLNRAVLMVDNKAIEATARRLRREDWIAGAIGVLADGGVEALGVNALADRLKVTKGSFYWHFRDREALLDAVVDTWRRRTTSEIEAFIRDSVGSPAGRLRRLVRIAISPRLEVPGGPLEMTLRDWARRDRRIDEIVQEVDERRLVFLEELYREAGSDAARARSLAVLHMSYVVGSRILLSGRRRQDYEESCRIAEDILVPGP